MLQTIREHTQGWIAGTVIGIIILSFALWGIHSYFEGGGNNSVVAEVNGVEITKEQLAVAYERLRRQAQAQYGINTPISAKDDVALKNRALRSLIEIEVLKQASSAEGFSVSDQQIDNYLQNMPEFQVDGQFSIEKFQEILSSTLLSTGEFLGLIKTSLLLDQPKLGVIFSSYALQNETAYTVALVNEERDINYIDLPLQNFLSQPISIAPEKIKIYYERHKAEFMTPEQVNVDYVELTLKDLSTRITPTETMLKSFYNENINAYTRPTEWKLADIEIPLTANASQEDIAAAKHEANEVLKLVEKGDDFVKLARKYPGSFSSSNWVALNQVPAELQKAVAELAKSGQVSDLVKTSKGLVVVKAVDIKEPKIQPFDAVKDKVKESYVHQHAEEKFAELREQLADATYEHPDSLQYASKTLNLPVKSTDLFTKEKSGSDIAQFKKVRDAAFSNDVLNLQNNSDVLQLNPETVVVIRVKSHIASALLPLNSISKQIEDKLKNAEAEQLAQRFAQDLTAKLQAGGDPQQIANANKLSWKKTGFIGRYATKVDFAVLDLAFRMPKPNSNAQKPAYGIARLPNGYAIVMVNAVKQGSVPDKKQNAIFAEQVQNSEGLLEYELYKQSQMNKAKIKLMQS